MLIEETVCIFCYIFLCQTTSTFSFSMSLVDRDLSRFPFLRKYNFCLVIIEFSSIYDFPRNLVIYKIWVFCTKLSHGIIVFPSHFLVFPLVLTKNTFLTNWKFFLNQGQYLVISKKGKLQIKLLGKLIFYGKLKIFKLKTTLVFSRITVVIPWCYNQM